jgi:hypothetical protein
MQAVNPQIQDLACQVTLELRALTSGYWTVQPDTHQRYDCVELADEHGHSFDFDSSHPYERITIYANLPQGLDKRVREQTSSNYSGLKTPASITVSAGRTAKAIAADINRRFLTDLFAWHEKLADAQARYLAEDAQGEERAATILHALGNPTLSNHGLPGHATFQRDDEGKRAKKITYRIGKDVWQELELEFRYDGSYDLRIRNCPQSLALCLIEALREWMPA